MFDIFVAGFEVSLFSNFFGQQVSEIVSINIQYLCNKPIFESSKYSK